MFVVIDNNDRVVIQSHKLEECINVLGFLNKQQYYNYKAGKIKNKFKHLDGYKIWNINQKDFFSPFLNEII